jgi:hypothetical protein
MKEDVYIRQPLGFKNGTPKVCHLKRCLYGQNKPPRIQHHVAGLTCRQGWRQCTSDPCIYIVRTGIVFAMIALYVDDIPAACNNPAWVTSFKAQLGAKLKIKDLDALS